MAEQKDSANPATSAADETRAKAEARRQRIMKKSSQRMGLVSGEQVKQEAVSEEEAAAAAVESSNASSRMQAMRRRRIKKQQQAKEETAISAAATDADPSKETETKDEPAEKKDETPAVATPPVVEKPKAATTGEASTRKYKGVAAVRRQRLKEKAAKESAAASAVPSTEKSVTAKLPERKKLAIDKLPIIMHLLAIFVLFTAGLHVGAYQMVQEHVTVHRELLAPQEHGIGMLRLVDRATNMFSGTTSADRKALLQQEQDGSFKPIKGLKDEFGGDDDDDDEYVPNIDPVFQLDLDQFTKGNSPLMIAARVAIYMHRLNLYFFYYLPMRIFTAVMHIPAKLIQTPPLLFAFCLFVRQFFKRVLGAALPEEPTKAEKGDVLSMVKAGVMTFLSSSFPTMVEFYDAFTHLRSDMFVLLCGFFVGLAWNHHMISTGGHEEL